MLESTGEALATRRGSRNNGTTGLLSLVDSDVRWTGFCWVAACHGLVSVHYAQQLGARLTTFRISYTL